MSQKQKQIICCAGNHSHPEIAGHGVHVAYDTIRDADIFRFSGLNNGSGIKTSQFCKEFAERIHDTLGGKIALVPRECGVVSTGSSPLFGQATAKKHGAVLFAYQIG